MNINLFTEIVEAQKNRDHVAELIAFFNPLLKKYAYLLNYEDAYDELQIKLIELIYNLDLKQLKRTDNYTLLSYIKTCIHNCYIQKSKKYAEYTFYNRFIGEMSEESAFSIESQFSTLDTYQDFHARFYRLFLTQSECEIIFYLFYKQFTVSETAKAKKISRQAVNQLKLSALKKLRAKLKNDLQKVI